MVSSKAGREERLALLRLSVTAGRLLLVVFINALHQFSSLFSSRTH